MSIEKENLHAGHRKRLKERYYLSKNSLQEHEILELLLCYSIPRKNTNDIAHHLLKTFGSLENILNADIDGLKEIDGLGENSALLINLISYIFEKTKNSQQSQGKLSTIEKSKQTIIDLFKQADHELFYVLFLNKKDLVTKIEKFDSNDKNQVVIDMQKLTKSIAINNPASIIIAHNHFSKYPKPSLDDDKTTAKLIYLLNSLRVNFYDHLIVSGNEIYSYFYDNRIQLIKNKIKNELL